MLTSNAPRVRARCDELDVAEQGDRVAGALLRENEGPDWMRQSIICHRVASSHPSYYKNTRSKTWTGQRPAGQMM